MQTRIKSYTFAISEPYQAGTIITKGEAQALNTLRLENIANNMRELVNREITLAGAELLSKETLAALQAKFTEYDHGYQFLEKSSPRFKPGDIDQEARVIARERVEAQLRQIGSTLDEERMEAAIAENEKLPGVQEEARLRVSARRRVISDGLESLV